MKYLTKEEIKSLFKRSAFGKDVNKLLNNLARFR